MPAAIGPTHCSGARWLCSTLVCLWIYISLQGCLGCRRATSLLRSCSAQTYPASSFLTLSTALTSYRSDTILPAIISCLFAISKSHRYYFGWIVANRKWFLTLMVGPLFVHRNCLCQAPCSFAMQIFPDVHPSYNVSLLCMVPLISSSESCSWPLYLQTVRLRPAKPLQALPTNYHQWPTSKNPTPSLSWY